MVKEKKIGQLWKIVSMSNVINEHFYIIIDKPKRSLDKRWTICWINFDGKTAVEEWSSKDMEDDILVADDSEESL